MSKTQSRSIEKLSENEIKVTITTTEVRGVIVDLESLREEKKRHEDNIAFIQQARARELAEAQALLDAVEAQITEALGLGVKDKVKP